MIETHLEGPYNLDIKMISQTSQLVWEIYNVVKTTKFLMSFIDGIGRYLNTITWYGKYPKPT